MGCRRAKIEIAGLLPTLPFEFRTIKLAQATMQYRV